MHILIAGTPVPLTEIKEDISAAAKKGYNFTNDFAFTCATVQGLVEKLEEFESNTVEVTLYIADNGSRIEKVRMPIWAVPNIFETFTATADLPPLEVKHIHRDAVNGNIAVYCTPSNKLR